MYIFTFILQFGTKLSTDDFFNFVYDQLIYNGYTSSTQFQTNWFDVFEFILQHLFLYNLFFYVLTNRNYLNPMLVAVLFYCFIIVFFILHWILQIANIIELFFFILSACVLISILIFFIAVKAPVCSIPFDTYLPNRFPWVRSHCKLFIRLNLPSNKPLKTTKLYSLYNFFFVMLLSFKKIFRTNASNCFQYIKFCKFSKLVFYGWWPKPLMFKSMYKIEIIKKIKNLKMTVQHFYLKKIWWDPMFSVIKSKISKLLDISISRIYKSILTREVRAIEWIKVFSKHNNWVLFFSVFGILSFLYVTSTFKLKPDCFTSLSDDDQNFVLVLVITLAVWMLMSLIFNFRTNKVKSHLRFDNNIFNTEIILFDHHTLLNFVWMFVQVIIFLYVVVPSLCLLFAVSPVILGVTDIASSTEKGADLLVQDYLNENKIQNCNKNPVGETTANTTIKEALPIIFSDATNRFETNTFMFDKQNYLEKNKFTPYLCKKNSWELGAHQSLNSKHKHFEFCLQPFLLNSQGEQKNFLETSAKNFNLEHTLFLNKILPHYQTILKEPAYLINKNCQQEAFSQNNKVKPEESKNDCYSELQLRLNGPQVKIGCKYETDNLNLKGVDLRSGFYAEKTFRLASTSSSKIGVYFEIGDTCQNTNKVTVVRVTPKNLTTFDINSPQQNVFILAQTIYLLGALFDGFLDPNIDQPPYPAPAQPVVPPVFPLAPVVPPSPPFIPIPPAGEQNVNNNVDAIIEAQQIKRLYYDMLPSLKFFSLSDLGTDEEIMYVDKLYRPIEHVPNLYYAIFPQDFQYIPDRPPFPFVYFNSMKLLHRPVDGIILHAAYFPDRNSLWNVQLEPQDVHKLAYNQGLQNYWPT